MGDEEIFLRPLGVAFVPARIKRRAGRAKGGVEGFGILCIGAPPPNQALLVVRNRVFMCTAGTCGLAMCATRLMPVAVKPGASGLAPLIVAANCGAKVPCTVETFTPTFSNTRPFITARTPPPPSLSSSVWRSHGV